MRDSSKAFDGRTSTVGGGQIDSIILERIAVDIRNVVPDLASSNSVLELGNGHRRRRVGVEGGRVNRDLDGYPSSTVLRVIIFGVILVGLDRMHFTILVCARPKIDRVFALVQDLNFAGCLSQCDESWQGRGGEECANHSV